VTRSEYDCAGCGTTFSGNHAVRGGEHYCNECEPETATGRRFDEDHSDAEPQTVEEYMANRGTIIDVSALMDGGDPR